MMTYKEYSLEMADLYESMLDRGLADQFEEDYNSVLDEARFLDGMPPPAVMLAEAREIARNLINAQDNC